MKSTYAVALLLGSILSAASPAHAQTATTAGTASAGDPVDRMIVFGDSLADGGYYLTLDPRLARDAGSFTTNPDPVAPEVLAARLGLPLDPVYGKGGTNYAVGGARVTAANALSIPITTQIGNFLAAGGSFGPRDLVYIQGGGNDYFAFQAAGSTNNATLTTAATQLAAQVSRLQTSGATRIVTLAVQSGGAAGIQLFNRTYAAALAAETGGEAISPEKLVSPMLAKFMAGDRVFCGVGVPQRTERARCRQLPKNRLRRSWASTLIIASSAVAHSPPRTEPSRHPATTCRASSIFATKYCVPRASLGAAAIGDGMAMGAVCCVGAMTGRKTKPLAKPMTKVTSTMMIVLLCHMAITPRTFRLNY